MHDIYSNNRKKSLHTLTEILPRHNILTSRKITNSKIEKLKLLKTTPKNFTALLLRDFSLRNLKKKLWPNLAMITKISYKAKDRGK